MMGGFGGGNFNAMQSRPGTTHTRWQTTKLDQHQLYSISAMKQYMNKSVLELRFEDYSMGVTGGNGGGTVRPSIGSCGLSLCRLWRHEQWFW